MSPINPQEKKNSHGFRLRCSFEEKQKDLDSQVHTKNKFSMHPLCKNRHTLNKKLETENCKFNFLLLKENGVAEEAKSDVEAVNSEPHF